MDATAVGQLVQLGIGAVTLVILWQLWLAYKELQAKLFDILTRLADVLEQNRDAIKAAAESSREGSQRQG